VLSRIKFLLRRQTIKQRAELDLDDVERDIYTARNKLLDHQQHVQWLEARRQLLLSVVFEEAEKE
jgi:hypothetical protein